MATNPFFNQKHPGEQALQEAMNIEHIKMFGQDMVYVPREMINEDKLFGEGKRYKFEDAFPIEMYIDSASGFEGAGDLISKFGLQIKDRMTFVMAKRRFLEEVTANRADIVRPREGDLIFMPLSNSLFEINFVEHEQPFYVHGRNYTYKITCELFTYDHSKVNTGVTEIDAVQEERHWIPKVLYLVQIPGVTAYNFFEGETVKQYLEATGQTGITSGSILSSGTVIQYVGISGGTSTAYVTTADGFTLGGIMILAGDSSGAKQYISGISGSDVIVPKNSLMGDNFGDNDITSLESRTENVVNYCEDDPFSEGSI